MNTQELRNGDRVRAVQRITADLAGKDTLHARAGDGGVVVHTEEGRPPTVQFETTGLATIVFDEEIERA